MNKINKCVRCFVSIALLLLLFACEKYDVQTISYKEFEPFIKAPTPTENDKQIFNLDAEGISKTVVTDNGDTLSGFATNNKKFFTLVVDLILKKYVEELKKQSPTEAINNLAIFSHQVYQNYFGKGFYRWGGDIFDLDHPQKRGSSYNKLYGLDCSGFVNMPYELAVHYGILDSLAESSVFSSKGFKEFSLKTGLEDGGGRNKTSNHYRIDTYDIFRLGRLVTTIEAGTFPSDEQMKMLQPGDLVGRSGHVGMIVKINNELYYLESGGRVLPNNGYKPADAKNALAIFAARRPVYIRRSLPDRN
ncbi:MAG: hypothetical protein HND52_18755 [Ignavibacteriae bacterium]|nr:hypothetical protein [Ignavibacteriota bacterium]NOH00006.1 hypothetical protein [Ignavibacteriota bacterium]